MGLTLKQFGIDRLSPTQRLELISLLWDSLPAEVPFVAPDSHVRELERRVTAADAERDAAEPWEELRARLSKRP